MKHKKGRLYSFYFVFFSSRRRHTRYWRDWSSDVCSSDLTPVTFLVGENGSGKSTVLEALAAAVGSVVVGGEDVRADKTLGHARAPAAQLKLVWGKRTHRGFFLRAEAFFNFTRRVNQTSAELLEMGDEFERDGLKGYGLSLARGVALGQRGALTSRYGEDADARSHGESFLSL